MVETKKVKFLAAGQADKVLISRACYTPVLRTFNRSRRREGRREERGKERLLTTEISAKSTLIFITSNLCLTCHWLYFYSIKRSTRPPNFLPHIFFFSSSSFLLFSLQTINYTTLTTKTNPTKWQTAPLRQERRKKRRCGRIHDPVAVKSRLRPYDTGDPCLRVGLVVSFVAKATMETASPRPCPIAQPVGPVAPVAVMGGHEMFSDPNRTAETSGMSCAALILSVRFFTLWAL